MEAIAKHAASWLFFTTLGVLGFVAIWAVVLGVLPLLQGWWGFAAGTLVVVAIVSLLNLD
jgi:hypothetical protein